MEKIAVSEISNLLQNHLPLTELSKFADALEVPAATRNHLRILLNNGTNTPYDLLNALIEDWVSRNREKATTGNLRRILHCNSFQDAAESMQFPETWVIKIPQKPSQQGTTKKEEVQQRYQDFKQLQVFAGTLCKIVGLEGAERGESFIETALKGAEAYVENEMGRKDVALKKKEEYENNIQKTFGANHPLIFLPEELIKSGTGPLSNLKDEDVE